MNNLTENEKRTLEWLLQLGNYKLKELESQCKHNSLFEKRKKVLNHYFLNYKDRITYVYKYQSTNTNFTRI